MKLHNLDSVVRNASSTLRTSAGFKGVIHKINKSLSFVGVGANIYLLIFLFIVSVLGVNGPLVCII